MEGGWINLSSSISRAALSPVERGIRSLADWRAFKSALEASESIDEYCWNGEVLLAADISGLEARDTLSVLSVPLNGNGHSISINADNVRALVNTLSADVHDLSLSGSIDYGSGSATGALAHVVTTGVTISNVSSSVAVRAFSTTRNGSSVSLRAGGLAGTVSGDGTVIFRNCTVDGSVTVINYVHSVGGIIAHGGSGQARVVLEGCTFNGSISYSQSEAPQTDGKDFAAGRIGGIIGDASREVVLDGCSTGASATIDVHLNGMSLGGGGIGGLVGRTTKTTGDYTMQVDFLGTNVNRAAITVYDALASQHSRCGQVVGSVVQAYNGSATESGSLTFVNTSAPAPTSGHFRILQISGRNYQSFKPLAGGTKSLCRQYMSYVLVTGGGKVIVIDGGWEEDAPTLRSKISSLGGRVDAWFLSHPHQDHFGALSDILASPAGISIGTIYHSRVKPGYYEAGGVADLFYQQLDAFGGTVVDIRTPGGRYDIDGVGIKVLAVADEALSSNLNNSSVVLRVWDDSKTAVFLGDCGVPEGRKILGQYRADLDCDYLQLAHHGNKGCDENFYRTVHFNYALVPTSEWIWHPELYYSEMQENLDGGATRGWIESLLPADRIITSYEHTDLWLDNAGTPASIGGYADGGGNDYF